MTSTRETRLWVGTFAAGNRLLDLGTAACRRAGPHQRDHQRPPCLPRLRRGAGRAVRARRRRAPPPGDLVTTNATGCLEVFSTPYPSRRGRSRGCTPSSATPRRRGPAWRPGCARQGRATRVVGRAVTAAPVDIGFGCLSGMFERNDDVLFVCYDNQGYMNTGVQRSRSHPGRSDRDHLDSG